MDQIGGQVNSRKVAFARGSLFGVHFTLYQQLPSDIAFVTRAMSSSLSHIDVILDSNVTEMPDIPEWVGAFQSITDVVAESSMTASQKRQEVAILFLHDIKRELAVAILKLDATESEVATWVRSGLQEDVEMMGSLGLWREIYVDKHLDRDTKWSRNDLIDMLFLTTASGYANYVVGERSMVNHLKQAAKRIGRPLKIYSRLSDLVLALKADRH